MNYILFDEPSIRKDLLPLTYTRPVAGIRVGILTISEKWAHYLKGPCSFLTANYLSSKFVLAKAAHNLLINGAVCPSPSLVEAIANLRDGESLVQGELVLAASVPGQSLDGFETIALFAAMQKKNFNEPLHIIRKPWDIFSLNAAEIRTDFTLLTNGRTSEPLDDPHTIVYKPENIFIEKGAHIRAAVLNAEDGPIYIGKDAHIQEGALIKGPFALCEGATVNMGGKMRGDSTIGPYSKVGGEISNSVILGYSNKGHDGFLGNSVIGEWCNLGADTNTSNLKNTYANVHVWNYAQQAQIDTGVQFCGLIMGDHCKAGINTMFNTGTVAGVGANIFGAGFPAKHIPSFSWGGADTDFETYKLPKFYEAETRVMARRKKSLDYQYKAILEHIFAETSPHRKTAPSNHSDNE